MREHYKGLEKQGLDIPQGPEVNPHIMYLWEWFCQVGPVGWADLQAWQQMKGIELAPWEAEALIKLGRIWT